MIGEANFGAHGGELREDEITAHYSHPASQHIAHAHACETNGCRIASKPQTGNFVSTVCTDLERTEKYPVGRVELDHRQLSRLSRFAEMRLSRSTQGQYSSVCVPPSLFIENKRERKTSLGIKKHRPWCSMLESTRRVSEAFQSLSQTVSSLWRTGEGARS